jgi:hypothetical protein
LRSCGAFGSGRSGRAGETLLSGGSLTGDALVALLADIALRTLRSSRAFGSLGPWLAAKPLGTGRPLRSGWPGCSGWAFERSDAALGEVFGDRRLDLADAFLENAMREALCHVKARRGRPKATPSGTYETSAPSPR